MKATDLDPKTIQSYIIMRCESVLPVGLIQSKWRFVDSTVTNLQLCRMKHPLTSLNNDARSFIQIHGGCTNRIAEYKRGIASDR